MPAGTYGKYTLSSSGQSFQYRFQPARSFFRFVVFRCGMSQIVNGLPDIHIWPDIRFIRSNGVIRHETSVVDFHFTLSMMPLKGMEILDMRCELAGQRHAIDHDDAIGRNDGNVFFHKDFPYSFICCNIRKRNRCPYKKSDLKRYRTEMDRCDITVAEKGLAGRDIGVATKAGTFGG